MKRNKLVIFGAGRIGRSFIGQLFSVSGYEVVFVDTDPVLINNINRSKKYRIIVKSDSGDNEINVENVRGIHASDKSEVVNELAGSGIAAVSVGQKGLPSVVPIIAEALLLRRQKYGDFPLDIILAENLRNADLFVADELTRYLPPDYPADRLTGLVETSIGKMVPIMSEKDTKGDPLLVFAEPYNTLIVAGESFRNPVPDVKNLEPKTNIKAWVDRKLFIHNLGHSTAAYIGHRKYPDAAYMYEVLDDPDIYELTRSTMLQSALTLQELYPHEFSTTHLEAHIYDLLERFRNKALNDTVFRAGCDLYRKLGPEDRLVAPLKAAIRLDKPCDLILNAIFAAIHFRAKDENGKYFPSDEDFFNQAGKGTHHILKTVCGLNKAELLLIRSS
jgi:mannitol-1-phosphate 5-dehydrogenase